MDNMFPLVNSLSSRNRDYVLFLGAGFSKDAGIVSGWDILIHTLKPLYVNETGKQSLDDGWYQEIETWYLKHPEYSRLGYSELLETLHIGELERREHLRAFFKDAKPGNSHRAAAKLIKQEYIRIVFTTNFDDLLEKALEELDVDYDVIFSDDILAQSKTWDRVQTCRIYKLHGDYNTGKVRNTLEEISKLDKKIGEDFQYIIDRHGIVVVGYAGKDQGVMRHFSRRPPYRYPIFWQYREMPSNDPENILFHDLVKKYETKKREIKFIQDLSAASFLESISSSIERLTRVVVTNSDDSRKFREYIVGNDSKKIRALSMDIILEFSSKTKDAIQKEDKDRAFSYKYEVFTEYCKQIFAPFSYIEELLKFDLKDEAVYVANSLLSEFTSFEYSEMQEFIRFSGGYLTFMVLGSIFLRSGKIDAFRDNFYHNTFKIKYGKIVQFTSKISLAGEGWEYVAKVVYKQDYFAKKFTIIMTNHLPPTVSDADFKTFDAFITMDIALHNFPYNWFAGSSIYSSFFLQAYYDYFDKLIVKIEIATDFVNALREKYKGYSYDIRQGIDDVITTVSQKFRQAEN